MHLQATVRRCGEPRWTSRLSLRAPSAQGRAPGCSASPAPATCWCTACRAWSCCWRRPSLVSWASPSARPLAASKWCAQLPRTWHKALDGPIPLNHAQCQEPGPLPQWGSCQGPSQVMEATVPCKLAQGFGPVPKPGPEAPKHAPSSWPPFWTCPELPPCHRRFPYRASLRAALTATSCSSAPAARPCA